MDKQRKKEQMFSGGGTEHPTFREKNWYQKKIIEIVNQIDNEKYLKMIYGFVKRLKE